MELTIAIWKDCKRLLTDNQPITCRRLQPFADIKVHVELLRVLLAHLFLQLQSLDNWNHLHWSGYCTIARL